MGLSVLSPPESPFDSPSIVYTLLHHPLTVLFTFLHYLFLCLRGAPYRRPANSIPIRVVCISDTHSKIPRQAIPQGDLLIHAGDLTNHGTLSEIQQAIDWLKTLQKPWYGSSDGFRYIVVVAGNHDSYLDERSRSTHDKRNVNRKLDWGKIHYLQHSSITLPFPGGRKLNVYGAPQIPECGGKEFAFQYTRGQDAWTNTIPDDVDVLVTHNPPQWHLDIAENGGLGDEFELQEVWRVKPTLHVFGHVHSGYGVDHVWWDEGQKSFEQVRQLAFGKPRVGGPLSEIADTQLWTTGFKTLWSDIRGLLWTRLGGGARQGGIMVNAALTYQTTNKLRNKPRVVVL